MNNVIDGTIGVSGLLLTSSFMDNIPSYVSIICTCAITLVTCIVQVYRMWRDRDKDLKNKTNKEDKKENNKNV